MPHSVSPASSREHNDEEMTDVPVAPAPEGGVKLEDMFDGDDDEEEFPASSAQDVKMQSSPAPAPAE